MTRLKRLSGKRISRKAMRQLFKASSQQHRSQRLMTTLETYSQWWAWSSLKFIARHAALKTTRLLKNRAADEKHFSHTSSDGYTSKANIQYLGASSRTRSLSISASSNIRALASPLLLIPLRLLHSRLRRLLASAPVMRLKTFLA